MYKIHLALNRIKLVFIISILHLKFGYIQASSFTILAWYFLFNV